jgi:hypothetical protein
MILARLARRRSISWLAALLWMSAVAAAITEPRVSGDGQLLEHAVVAHGDALPAARSAAAGAVARLVAQDRSFDGVLFAPPERMALHVGDEHRRPRSRTTTELTGASRPRRLAFRYDATAPPRLL